MDGGALVGCSPWGREESDTTEQLHFHFSLLCIGEGNGNLLQCSCLENPRDGGAWQAAIYGVAQSRTRLKRLSSSNSRPSGRAVKNLPADAGTQETRVRLLGWEDPLESEIALQYSCLGNFHGQRSLEAYSPWGHKESDKTEHLSMACTGVAKQPLFSSRKFHLVTICLRYVLRKDTDKSGCIYK